MKREKEYIEKVGSYTFGDNYELFFRNEINYFINCNITCGNNCEVYCGWSCNITCGNNCEVYCGWSCNITCGNNCKITCHEYSYIKGGEGSKLKSYGNFSKTILKDEEFIWWYLDKKFKLINTFEDKNWKNKNPDKFKELYPFVHNELDLATLF